MRGLDFKVSLLDYADLPQYGPDHLLARLRAADPGTADFPLLRKNDTPEPSGSEFLDPAGLARILNASNAGAAVPESSVRYVTAGQQAGLLTGPLYTFLKAVTAVSLAAGLEKSTGERHVPLFWMASEDHDLLEVNRVTVSGRSFLAGDPSDAAPARRRQTAAVSLETHRAALLGFLDEALPGEVAHRSTVLDMVAASSFETYAAHFHELMQRIFAGSERRLVIADPIPLRPLTAPVLARLVEKWPEVLAAFAKGADLLRARGFEPPLAEPGLFEIAGDGARVKVDITAEGAVLSGGRCTLAEAAGAIRRRPEAFSPNAALRPVLQDAVIPSSACIGGPTELLYLWQIDPVYDAAGVRRARLRPRIAATFLEPRILRAARKAALTGAALFSSRRMLDGVMPPLPEAPGGSDEPGERDLHEAGQRLLDILDRILDENDDRSLRRGRDSLAGQLDRVRARVERIRAEKAGRSRTQLETIADAVLPGGRLQDRGANVMEFLARHGTDFVDRAVERLDPWEIGHLLVEIEPGRPAGARDGNER